MADGDRNVEAGALPAQLAFVQDTTSSPLIFIGGYRSGKTRAGAMKMLALGIANAPCLGMFVAPTYPMVRDVVYRTCQQVLAHYGIPYRWHKQEHILTVAPGYPQEFDVLLRSGDNPERLVGITAGWAIIDEPGLQDEAVAEQVLARVSDPRAKFPQLCLTGTPEGLNWLYTWAVEKPSARARVVRARTTDNPFLHPDYVPGLRARFSDEEVEAYLNGEFVLLEGAVYKQFRRTLHARPCPNPLEGDLVVGADFNVGRMAWVIGRTIGDEGHIWGELVRENTDTHEQVDALIEYLGDVYAREGERFTESERKRVTVYVDASAKARKTSATRSDVEIIRAAGFRVVAESRNPPVRDRIATVNARFRGERLFVDAVAAPALASALEQQRWRGNEPLKDGLHDGPVDALGYLAWGHIDWRTSIPRGNSTAHSQAFH